MKYLITYGYDDRGRIYMDNFLPIPEEDICVWRICELLGEDPPEELKNSISKLCRTLRMIQIRQASQRTRALVLTAPFALNREDVEAWLKVASKQLLREKSFLL